MSALSSSDLERCRQFWAEIAQVHGWYTEPFFVQVWIDKDGTVLDSVSYPGLDRDYVVEE